jgi:hypothetical protein
VLGFDVDLPAEGPTQIEAPAVAAAATAPATAAGGRAASPVAAPLRKQPTAVPSFDDDGAAPAPWPAVGPAASLAAAAADHTDSDDIDIGEVSRVVNLADLAREATARKAAAAAAGTGGPSASGVRRTQGVAALRATGANPTLRAPTAIPGGLGGLGGPGGSGGFANTTASADAGAAIDPATGLPAPAPYADDHGVAAPSPVAVHHRNSMVLLIIALLVLGAIVAVVFAVSSSSSDDDAPVHIATRNIDDITSRPDDPSHPRGPTQSGSDSAGSATKPTVRHPNTGGNSNGGPLLNPGSGSGTGTGSSGKTEVDLTGQGAVTELKPQDVEDMSAKQSSGSTRCYEQALKKDIFLDVKRIAVTITVDPSGQVTDVALSERGADPLGKCLSSRIRGWKFRPSTKGITAKFTMVFQN